VIAVIPAIFLKFSFKKRKRRRKRKSKFKKEFKEGFAALKEVEGLISLLVLFAAVSFFVAPFFILSTYFVAVTHSGTALDVALVQALFQAGIIVGAIIVFTRKKWNKKVLTILRMIILLFVG